jgi:hypothetical protein
MEGWQEINGGQDIRIKTLKKYSLNWMVKSGGSLGAESTTKFLAHVGSTEKLFI